jgi:hypothetical protein
MLRPLKTLKVTDVPAQMVVLVDCVIVTLGVTGAPVIVIGVLVAVDVNKQLA